ncbi:thiamine-phosphate kinase [SAR202 cluster bacterium AD-802-E10_MRT_200m]|nr:thiamine-phosphate kinase [SAR202 cluster bacterium AD-802-E10_MRT_200m]
MSMNIEELGEFGLIERLKLIVTEKVTHNSQTTHDATLLLGIGDDAAVWSLGNEIELFTTDTMVENVHFSTENSTWQDIGWKALAVNISDIAAMGGVPKYAAITLGLPPSTQVESMIDLYKGIQECGLRYNTTIIGGDMVSSQTTFITIGLTGITSGPFLCRAAARTGDRIAVTGNLGSSSAGLRLINENLQLNLRDSKTLRQAHLRPQPRLQEGQTLLNLGVKTAMDVSDGLIADLAKLCLASAKCATVWSNALPIASEVWRTFPSESIDLALSGGEDYELLFTAPQEIIDKVIKQLSIKVSIIGEILEGIPGKVTVVDKDNNHMNLNSEGWDHFQLWKPNIL